MSQPARPLAPAMDPPSARAAVQSVATNLSRALLGKSAEIERSITCLLARGHLLLEDAPGVGKTSLAEGLARSFGLSFARVQFTSDLMPADILGAQVLKPQTQSFEFRPGPLFHQLVLADELNRSPPRTQSALLEAMGHGQVSLDGVTHPLPRPFVVVATQNPMDLAGTYPLPDSQLDRFLMRVSIGHPAPEVEKELVLTRTLFDPVRSLDAVSSPELLLHLQEYSACIRIEDSAADYAVRLATATREHADLERGASTRAVLALVAAAKAQAIWSARDFVTPGDIRAVLAPCLAHRLLLRSAVHGTFAREETAHLVEEIAASVDEPK